MKYVSRKKVAKYCIACFILIFIVKLKLDSVDPVTLLYKYVDPLYPSDGQEEGAEADLISSSSQVRLWMDIPNAFPWRHCLQEYNNIITLLTCEKVGSHFKDIETEEAFQIFPNMSRNWMLAFVQIFSHIYC